MALVDEIQQNYPQYAWALNDPELGPLLREAADPAQPFSTTRFQAKLMATRWWRKQSESQRAWAIKLHTDPGSAQQDRAAFYSALQNEARRLGVQVTASEIKWISEVALAHGQAPDDPQVLNGLLRIYQRGPRRTAGAFTASRNQVTSMARNDYFVTMSDRSAFDWGTSLVTGTRSEEALKQYLGNLAASRYPHLAKDLKSGKTMRELFDGHISTIAQELELDPETINLMDPKWSHVLDVYDGKTKEHRSATISETMSMARRDPRFWKTQNGEQLDAQMSNYLLKAFGKR